MTEEFAKYCFDRLAEMLARQQLVWVLDEVNSTIRLGKLRTKKLRVEDSWSDETEPFVLSTEPRRNVSQTFTVSEPFTHREELQILLTAISSLTVDLAAIERRTARLIERSARKADTTEMIRQPVIVLHDENANKSVWTSRPDVRSQLTELAAKLSPLLELIREEIYAG